METEGLHCDGVVVSVDPVTPFLPMSLPSLSRYQRDLFAPSPTTTTSPTTVVSIFLENKNIYEAHVRPRQGPDDFSIHPSSAARSQTHLFILSPSQTESHARQTRAA